ncbi:MAG: hypothetical protein M1838_006043 [Thelocarpon superellum]|nr:MAG: hypothetical protein M1838_006043 [Thelocarpon superellum]
MIAAKVKAGLEPEYEVIHVILSTAGGVAEIPALLKGETPSSGVVDNVGSKNYAMAPAAVIIGGGYKDADVAEMQEACKGYDQVPWLRLDMSIPTPPLGPLYGEAMVKRVKICLQGLVADGTVKGEGVYFY